MIFCMDLGLSGHYFISSSCIMKLLCPAPAVSALDGCSVILGVLLFSLGRALEVPV